MGIFFAILKFAGILRVTPEVEAAVSSHCMCFVPAAVPAVFLAWQPWLCSACYFFSFAVLLCTASNPA